MSKHRRATVVVIEDEERIDARVQEIGALLSGNVEILTHPKGAPITGWLDKETSEVIAFVGSEAVLSVGWLDGLLAGFGADRVWLQGDGSPEPPSCPSGDYGEIGLVGPVSEATRSAAQKIVLAEEDVAQGLAGYAARRLSALAGRASSAEWIDPFCFAVSRECLRSLLASGPLLRDFGEWSGADLALRVNGAGYRSAVAESVFVSRSHSIDLGHSEIGSIGDRLSFYGAHSTGGGRVVAAYRVRLSTLRDLAFFRASLARIAPIVDGVAIILLTNPLELQSDPAFARAVESGGLAKSDSSLLRACSDATALEVSGAFADWSTKILRARGGAFTPSVEVWQNTASVHDERNAVHRLARELGADWVLTLEHDEVVEDRIDRALLRRLTSHPNPMVRAYDLAFAFHIESASLVREDPPWGDGGNYHGGPHALRLWRLSQGSEAPRRVEGGSNQSVPEVGAQGWRVASLRLRRFSYLYAQDRERLGAPEPIEGIRVSTLRTRNGLGLHVLVYEREDPEDVARWLDVCHGVFDRVVLVWTSTVSSPSEALCEVARLHGAEIVEHPLADDLASARNAGIEALASSPSLGAAMFVDPDEWFADEVGDPVALRRMAESDRHGWLVQVANYRNDGDVPTISDSVRISRLDDSRTMRMNGRVHEGFSRSTLALQEQEIHPRLRYAPFILQHRGMTFDAERMGGKLDHYERLLRLELQDEPRNPGAWVSLGWHYANDGEAALAEECYRRAHVCAGMSYLPAKELGFVRLREARAMFEESLALLTESHQFYSTCKRITEFLRANAPPHAIIPRTGRTVLDLPSFPTPNPEAG